MSHKNDLRRPTSVTARSLAHALEIFVIHGTSGPRTHSSTAVFRDFVALEPLRSTACVVGLNRAG